MYPQTVVNATREGAALARFKTFLERDLGVDPTREIIQRKTIRLEQPLSNSQDSYNFDLYEVQGAQRPGEVKLNRNDLFVAMLLSVAVTKQDSDGRTGNHRLMTFADPNFFSGVDGASNAEFESVQTVFNGTLTMMEDNVEKLGAFLINDCEFAPEKQTFLATAPQVNAEVPQYGPTMEERGYIDLLTDPYFDGQRNNIIRLQLGPGAYPNLAGGFANDGSAVATSNVAVVRLQGFLVKNGGQYLNKLARR